MKKIRKAAAILLILALCITSLAAYESTFPNFIVGGELIASTTKDVFLPVAANKDTWQSFMAGNIGRNPDIFYQVTMDNMDQSDYYAVSNLEDYIPSIMKVNDNDVFAFVIARTVDNGQVPDGWLILSHYTKGTDRWSHIVWYFGLTD